MWASIPRNYLLASTVTLVCDIADRLVQNLTDLHALRIVLSIQLQTIFQEIFIAQPLRHVLLPVLSP